MMTLALLLTAVTGAWATDGVIMKELTVPSDWNNDETYLTVDEMTGFKDFSSLTDDEAKALLNSVPTGKVLIIYGAGASSNSFKAVINDGTTVDVAETTLPHGTLFSFKDEYKSYYTASDAIEVNPVAQPAANTQQWTFKMPASDVVLTPRYASATIYEADGETEKMAYETLKEAIQNVQNGETIKLDWDVTFTEKDDPIDTSYEGNGVTFTLDLNGHTIDGRALYDPCIVLNNDNDQITITDSSTDQTGGVKGFPAAGVGVIIFDGGRYYLGAGVDAENINDEWDDYVSEGWQLAGGKEFVDLEGGADANDGFTLRVDYAAFELTIGAGRFATFYDTHNITMIEENQNISFYTIKRGDIDLDNNVAKVTKVENAIIPAGLPLLVYNGGQQQQTVKLKVTTTVATPIPDIANEFVGTASGREFDDAVMALADYYALSGGKMFVPVYETGNIAPHKCWIQFLKQQGGARTITIVFDDATAISTVSGSPADTGDIYDLNGRKIVRGTSSNGTLRKGVYVKEGQKVIIK